MTEKNRMILGFAIVELLIAVVVIGILATITLAYYSNSPVGNDQHKQQKPATIKQKTLVSSLQSDLVNASTNLKLFYAENDQYPEGLDGKYCPTKPLGPNYCLKTSKGTTFTYSSLDPYQTYILDAIDLNGNKYRITNDAAPVKIADNKG